MENTFLNNIKEETNYKYTENGGVAKKTTGYAVMDLFGLGGSYRKRTEEDCILLFKNAIEEDEELAMKCLFYLRDILEGQGERRFFRVCYKWLCDNYPDVAERNMKYIALDGYGRWDDIIYAAMDTKLEDYMLQLVKAQLLLDVECNTPSLLGKWLPSENCSSHKSKTAANKIRKYLKMSHKEYRKTLSNLRTKINIVEKLMSENRWTDISFDKIPSRAGIIYKNAFARHEIIAKKYEAFIKDEKTKVNAKALYPYEVVRTARKLIEHNWDYDVLALDDIDRLATNKYWDNLPDYLEGQDCKMMCVCDTSGSMTGGYGSTAPIDVAISLSMYCAERIGEPFKNHYISFSSRPQMIKVEGVDFVDKVKRIYDTNLCENTNLKAVFDLIKDIALRKDTNKDDIPNTIVVISDMEIDSATEGDYFSWRWGDDEKPDNMITWTTAGAQTEMDKIREEYAAAGLEMPKLVYWNVDARQNTILDAGPDVSFVSGCSPIIFKSILTGKTGLELMHEVLDSKRYAAIK